VHVGDDRRHRQPPLEAQREVDHDADADQQDRGQAVGDQLLAHARADELDLAQLHAGVTGLEQAHYLFRQLGRAGAFLIRQADQHVAGAAEVLHLGLAHLQRFHAMADVGEVGRLSVLHFHHRAAGEFHRQVQALGGQEEHRQDEGHQRDRGGELAVAHERDVPFDAEKLHVS